MPLLFGVRRNTPSESWSQSGPVPSQLTYGSEQSVPKHAADRATPDQNLQRDPTPVFVTRPVLQSDPQSICYRLTAAAHLNDLYRRGGGMTPYLSGPAAL